MFKKAFQKRRFSRSRPSSPHPIVPLDDSTSKSQSLQGSEPDQSSLLIDPVYHVDSGSEASKPATNVSHVDTFHADPGVDGLDENDSYGIKILYNPSSAILDIVFIHGITGNAYSTWLHKSTNIHWPRDLIKVDITDARVMTFGYDADVARFCGQVVQDGIAGYARDLLGKLDRKRKNCGDRRIVFVAHSLGGLLVQRALTMSRESRHSHLQAIEKSTVGICFLGTPHHGADLAKWGSILSDIVNIAKKTNSAPVKLLQRDSEVLRDLQDGFHNLLEKRKSEGIRIEITCFYETLAHVRFMIVPSESAVIKGELSYPIQANHVDMTRFSSRKADGYEDVVGEIQRLASNNAAKQVDLRLRTQSIQPDSATDVGRHNPHSQEKMLQRRSTSSLTPLSDADKSCLILFSGFHVADYKAELPKPVEGTCNWILKHPQYVSWASKRESTLLWLTGNPGCGKTILSAYLTEQLDGPKHGSSAAFVCFYFCDDRVSAQKDGKSILRSIIYQILRRRRSLIKYLKAIIDIQGPNLASSFQSLWNIFLAITSDPILGPVHIVVDAIDECEAQTRDKFLNAVIELLQKPQKIDDISPRCIKIFMTSRPSLTNNYIFNGLLNSLLPLEEYQGDLSEDVKLVIERKVEQIVQKFNCPPEVEESLKQGLYSKADQTFLWVSIVLKYLEESLSASKTGIQKIITEVPRDLQAIYQNFLTTIPSENQGDAIKLLHLLIGSSRYLTSAEINIAFTINGAHKTIEQLKEDMPFSIKRTLQGILGPMVRISGFKVFLVHQSAKDFLLDLQLRRNQDLSISVYAVQSAEAALVLASSCISYLLLDEFSIDQFSLERHSMELSSNESPVSPAKLPAEEVFWDPFSLEEDNILKDQSVLDAESCQSLLDRFDFFGYASLHWAEHLNSCESIASADLLEAACKLIERSSNRLKNWLKFYWLKTGMEYQYPESFSALIIAAFYDLSRILHRLFDKSESYDQTEKDQALFWAARMGSAAAVEVLLRRDANPNVRMGDRPTALAVAAQHGHLSVVQLLIAEEQTDVNLGGRSNRSPLCFAAGQGHLNVVQTLLGHKSLRPDEQDDGNWTPIFWAVGGNNMDVVRELLHHQSSLDVNHKDKSGRTAISWAAGEGFLKPLSYLLKHTGVDPNLEDEKHRSPLSWAAGNGHFGAIRLLMKCKQVDKSSKDRDGRNAISWACGSGNEDALRTLLRYDCPGIDDKDIDGWTPLAWALNKNSLNIVMALLSTQQVQINGRDNNGCTPLVWSAKYGYASIVTFMLSQGADPEAVDGEGRTALDWAKMYGYTEVIQALDDN